jgi:hypothetical protein
VAGGDRLGAADRHCIGVVDQEVAGSQRVDDARGNQEEEGYDHHRADDQQAPRTVNPEPIRQGGPAALRDQEHEDGEGQNLEGHIGDEGRPPGDPSREPQPIGEPKPNQGEQYQDQPVRSVRVRPHAGKKPAEQSSVDSQLGVTHLVFGSRALGSWGAVPAAALPSIPYVEPTWCFHSGVVATRSGPAFGLETCRWPGAGMGLDHHHGPSLDFDVSRLGRGAGSVAIGVGINLGHGTH